MRAQEGAAACVPTSGTRGKAAPRAGAGLVDLALRLKFKPHFDDKETNFFRV